ncbi:MAG: type II toxin-antitoxin system VapC family toxin [Candidatus Binatia bacterium]
MARFVLDTSAILALRSDERGASRVEAILRNAPRAEVLASFMTRMEVLYRVRASEGEEEAQSALRLLDVAGVRWISCEPEILIAAARIMARGGLSVADAWIAATALVHRGTLVHNDPEFKRVSEIAQEPL